MKKLSVLLAVTGFSLAASAQQDGFFDIQKYLQKKKTQNKPPIKPLFSRPSFQNLLDNRQAGKLNNQRNFSHTLSNGDKVYLLSTDNMPCIIPDMTQFSIQNIFGFRAPILPPGNTPGNIPNIAAPGTGKVILIK